MGSLDLLGTQAQVSVRLAPCQAFRLFLHGGSFMNATAQALPSSSTVSATAQEWEKATKGHTPVFIYDNLLDIVLSGGFLSPPQFEVWSYLMRQSRRFRKMNFQLPHAIMMKALSISESGLRGHLNSLERLGFLEKQTEYNRFGKLHDLRPSVPKTILTQLKCVLNEARAKTELKAVRITPSPDTSSTAAASDRGSSDGTSTTLENITPPSSQFSSPSGCEKSSATLQDPAALIRSDNNKEKITLTCAPIKTEEEKEDSGKAKDPSEDRTVHLSWAGKPLSESQAYLPEAEAPPPPYQPRQDRPEDWVPSVEDWINTIGLNATPPRDQKTQRLFIDVADWTIQVKTKFLRESHANSGSEQGFGMYFMRNQVPLGKAFEAHLKSQLPSEVHEGIPTLLQRVKEFELSNPTPWFPETRSHLALAKQQFEARQSIKTEPKLSPIVALSLPASWFQRVVITAKNLKLSQPQILELAYHLKHFVIHKAFDNENERWKYRLCIAIKLIKEGRWSCPKGLESQRTRHQEEN